MKDLILIINGVIKKSVNIYNDDDVNAEVDFMMAVSKSNLEKINLVL
jgi:hypothetical protein